MICLSIVAICTASRAFPDKNSTGALVNCDSATSGLANQVSDKKLRFTFHHLSPYHGAIWQEMIGNKYENQNLTAVITCKTHRTFNSIAMEQNEAHFWFTADIFFDVYGLLSSFLQSHYDLLSFFNAEDFIKTRRVSATTWCYYQSQQCLVQ